MKANRIVTPTAAELQSLFNLPSGPESKPGQLAAPQPETLADPEAWVMDFLSDLDSPSVDGFDATTGRPLNDIQRRVAIAEKQREMLTAALPTAIRALRKKLGKCQEYMARNLGCHSLSCYVNWERGRAVPSGGAILMMLRLCPDVQTLANFGLAFPSSPSFRQRTAPEPSPATTDHDAEAKACYERLNGSLNILMEAAEKGDQEAAKILEDVSEETMEIFRRSRASSKRHPQPPQGPAFPAA